MNCSFQFGAESQLPFSIPAKSTVDFLLPMNTFQPGEWAQEITVFLDINNRMYQTVLPVKGLATEIAEEVAAQ